MTSERVAKPGSWISAPAYRIVPESEILDEILLFGWVEPAASDRRIARGLLDRLVALGLPFAEAGDERRFDPVEVTNCIAWFGMSGEEHFWSSHCVAADRQRVSTLRGSAAVSERLQVTVTLQRTLFPGPASTRPGRCRLPVPVPDGRASDLRVRHVETGGRPWRLSEDGSRIEVKHDGFAEPVVLTMILSFVPLPGAPDRDVGDRALYLRPSDGLIQVTGRVAALAAGLAGSRPPRSAVARFWDYLLTRMMFGRVHYDSLLAGSAAVDRVLASGWCDCQSGAALLIALCRASAIPARLICGYMLHRDAPLMHFWAEIWFEDEGWLPYDLHCWGLSAGGRAPAWREFFAGRLEPRMLTEVLPLRFTGHPGIAFPPAWTMTNARTGSGGAETRYRAVDDGRWLMKERVSVEIWC